MAFNNIDNLQLGNLLQIVFSDGVRNQISNDYRDWEYISRYRVADSVAREVKFNFQTTLGAAAIQYRNPGVSDRSFPDAQQVTLSEHTARFKELNATIELEYNLFDRARKSPEKYAEPLALEIQSKATSAKRRIAADLYADGTGVLGEVESATALSGASRSTLTLKSANDSRGHAGFFEFGDLIRFYQLNDDPSATADADVYRVVSKDRKNAQVVVERVSGSNSAPSADDLAYRVGQPTIPNLSGAVADFGTVTEVIAGMESLTANDGRTIHGITMEGANAGSIIDAQGQPLDVKFIQEAMDNVKVNVGGDRYSWKMMAMSPESHASLIESRETDRRFQMIDDNTRGSKFLAYLHQNDTLETYTSEYVPPKRIYMLPEAKSNQERVLEFWGSDFETVKGQGMGDFHLKPGQGGGHVNTIVSYLQSIGVIICKHPAAIARIDNFTV